MVVKASMLSLNNNSYKSLSKAVMHGLAVHAVRTAAAPMQADITVNARQCAMFI
jgi:hypothetical protein